MARIAIIDDSPDIHALLGAVAGNAGHEVRCAAGALEGLLLVTQWRPDVVLLDVEMPVRDGAWCLREIRNDPEARGAQVVMISALPVKDVVVRVAQLGANGFIIKDANLVKHVLARLATVTPGSGPAPRPGAPAPAAGAATAVGVAASAPAAPAPLSAPQPVPAPARPAPVLCAPLPESPPEPQVDEEWRTPSIDKALEELRTLKPIISRQELLDLMAANDELRAMGPAARQVISLASSEGSSIDAIAKAIRQDQALSLKVLRLSNSTLYCRGERVDSVKKAVQRIGVSQIRGTVMAMGVVSQFATGGLAGRLKAERFWEHSITTGLIAQRLAAAQRMPAEEADQMFTAGLLHDIGRMLYAERLGDRYARVIGEADRLGLPLETVESRLLLINHADMTDRLLRQWKFPAELINPIALHHLSVGNIRRMVPRAVKPVATLALANRLAHALLLGSSGNDVLYPVEEFVTALELSEETLAQVMRETPEQAFDMKTFMLASSGDGADAGRGALEDARARLGDGVRPLAVALKPALFGCAYAVERLHPLGATETPTVAVVRVAAPGERARLIDLLRERERDAGAGELPVLVLGASPGCFFPKGHLGARAVEQFVSPVRLERVLDALIQLSARPAAAAAA